jgi:hypothetical protein
VADLTLAEILASPTKDQILDDLLAEVARSEFPVTDWSSGGVVRTLLALEAEVLFDLISEAIPALAAEGFADTADGDWLTTVARGLFQRDRSLAGFPIQTITLAYAAGSTPTPLPITVGQTAFVATDGRRYVAATGGSLAAGGTLSVDVKAESPGASRGLVTGTAIPTAGVTVTAAAVKVVSTVPQFGADEEPDAALIERCEARWPSLEDVPDEDRLVRWAKAASTEVTRVRLDADPTYAGGILVTVAGAGGAVTGGAVTAVQEYFDERSAITDLNTAQNATNVQIDATGTVTVSAALADQVKAKAQEAWVAYLLAAQIGTAVFIDELTRAVIDAGAIDITDQELNGAGDVALASDQVPTPGDDLADALTWVTV